MKKMWRLMLCGLVLAMGMTGCLKNETQQIQALANVAVYHSSPDAPEMNIFIDKVAITTQPFKFKNYSNYLTVEEGDRNFRFNNYTNGTNIVDSTMSFEVGKSYSIFLVNTLSNIELLRTADVAAAPPSAGKAMIRLIHLSPDAPSVDVTWAGDASAFFAGQTFKQASDFKEISANTYSMTVKENGGKGVSIVVKDIILKEGQYYTILVEGFDTLPTGNLNALSARVVQN